MGALVRFLDGELDGLEVLLSVMLGLLAFLSLLVFLHCCMRCCGGFPKRTLPKEQQQITKDYYDEISTLLLRHREVEMKQIESEREMQFGDEELEAMDESEVETPKLRSRTNSEKLLKLKEELKQFQIDHNISVHIEHPFIGRRRTWRGLQGEGDDDDFEAVQLPNKANVESQTYGTLENLHAAVLLAEKRSRETTV